jgi:hypothetical protein
MAFNDRIFYACQAVIIAAPTGTTPAAAGIVRGLQSIGMNSNFTLEQVFELGQLEIYENIEDIADVEVTMEKVIDGEKLIFNLASNGLCKTDLVAAAKSRSDVYFAVYDDATSNATGEAMNVCWNSGMYVSSVSYSYSVDGNATESVTMVGNDKFWNADGNQTGTTADAQWGTPTNGEFGTPLDTPNSGVVRRKDIDLVASTLPAEVESQLGDPDGIGQGGGFHIQSISVSADFGQENINELGRFGPYAKFTSFPIEVTSEFEVIATSGDLKSVSGAAENLTDRTITLLDDAGTVLTLGAKNKLSGVSYSGGDTGGGNATVTYSYSNYNSLLVDDGGS